MNNLATIIESSKSSFIDKAAKMQTGLEYTVEANFGLQAISKNNHTTQIALKNPTSLRNAMTNLGAIGLSLNPAESLAYLVPRDDQICLDISYRGLVRLATNSGSMAWVQAVTVHQNDTFEFIGAGDKPIHKSNPFGDRGAMIGVYAIAKTNDGDFLTTTMTMDEIKKIQSSSKGATSKYSPWINYFNEMAKKAVIKRASKTWPMSDNHESQKLNEAINVLNENDGDDYAHVSDEASDYYAQLIKDENHLGLYVFFMGLEVEQQIKVSSEYVNANAEPRGKIKLKESIKQMRDKGRSMVEDYACVFIESTDETEVAELKAELSADEYEFINKRINEVSNGL